MLFEATMDNLAHMEFSQPMWVENFLILQPWPNEQSRLAAIIRPFAGTVS